VQRLLVAQDQVLGVQAMQLRWWWDRIDIVVSAGVSA
jgi:hypothetical protein